MSDEQNEIFQQLVFEVGTLNSGVSMLLEKDFAEMQDAIDSLKDAVKDLNATIGSLPQQIAAAVASAVQHLG
jgi:predicted translin family RNA/ssDNA-binding protein